MSEFDSLATEVARGMEGGNRGIPMGFHRLNRFIGIRKRIYSLVFGATGSGKTAFVHSAYVLNPFDWYMREKPDNIKLKIMLFSMERSKLYTQMKWVSRRIFLDQGILIPIGKLMGWEGFGKLTKDEHDLFLMTEDYIGSMEGIIDIIEGPQNPTGVYKYVKNYAEANGTIEVVDEHHKIYHPNHPNEIVIPIGDHFGLTKTEKGYNTKKEAIDKHSEYYQFFRDFYGYSPVAVAQVTRDLSNPIYQKMDSFEPNLDQVKESGRPGEDADMVASLFDPIRFKTTDPAYDVSNFVDPNTGAKYFRSVKVLKNTYGEDDIRIGMGFHGATGIFAELPRAADMDNFDYNDLIDGNYFINDYNKTISR